jgi:hypothetical protein
MPRPVDLDASIAALAAPRSPHRRSAAKKLRRLGDGRACPALLTALHRELEDARTWETQYQMIMALGECRCTSALPLLLDLRAQELKTPRLVPMARIALGDALVRLDPTPTNLLALAASADQDLVSGALRAVAMLRLVFEEAIIDRLIDVAGGKFWLVAAAAGWRGARVRLLLETCVASPILELKEAALASLAGTYKDWNPL